MQRFNRLRRDAMHSRTPTPTDLSELDALAQQLLTPVIATSPGAIEEFLFDNWHTKLMAIVVELQAAAPRIDEADRFCVDIVVPRFQAWTVALATARQQMASLRPPPGKQTNHEAMVAALAAVDTAASRMLAEASRCDLRSLEHTADRYAAAMDALVQTGRDLRMT